MLAMEAQAPLGVRLPALALTTIASMLAPTGEGADCYCPYTFCNCAWVSASSKGTGTDFTAPYRLR
ncbi:hypothetical protein D3C73_980580 [compost metagenome]